MVSEHQAEELQGSLLPSETPLCCGPLFRGLKGFSNGTRLRRVDVSHFSQNLEGSVSSMALWQSRDLHWLTPAKHLTYEELPPIQTMGIQT